MIQERTVDGVLGAFLYFTYCIMAGAAKSPKTTRYTSAASQKRKMESWYFESHSPEVRFVKLFWTARSLDEWSVGQEGVRSTPD
jgi:hypothetical protein